MFKKSILTRCFILAVLVLVLIGISFVFHTENDSRFLLGQESPFISGDEKEVTITAGGTVKSGSKGVDEIHFEQEDKLMKEKEEEALKKKKEEEERLKEERLREEERLNKEADEKKKAEQAEQAEKERKQREQEEKERIRKEENERLQQADIEIPKHHIIGSDEFTDEGETFHLDPHEFKLPEDGDAIVIPQHHKVGTGEYETSGEL
ncbi:unnamed protein product [Pichia kudriavzevii]|mgnify:CR=1 FL=1